MKTFQQYLTEIAFASPRPAAPQPFQPDPKDKPYQGWSNWHTWNAMLWLNNDEECYKACRHKTAEQIERFVRQYELNGDGFDWNKVNWKEVEAAMNED